MANEYGDQSIDLATSSADSVAQTYLELTINKEREYIYMKGGTIDLSYNSLGIYTKRSQQAINLQ